MSIVISHYKVVFTANTIALYRDLLRDGVHWQSEDSLLEYCYRKAIADNKVPFNTNVTAVDDGNGRYVGFAGVDHSGLLQIYVKPEYRRQRIGEGMLIEAKKHSPELYAIINNTNHRLCLKHGISYPPVYQCQHPSMVRHTSRI